VNIQLQLCVTKNVKIKLDDALRSAVVVLWVIFGVFLTVTDECVVVILEFSMIERMIEMRHDRPFTIDIKTTAHMTKNISSSLSTYLS
jgi:hypothetical protein